MGTKQHSLENFQNNKGVYISDENLAIDTDTLSTQEIKKYLKSSCSKLKVEVFSTLESTNTLAKKKAAMGIPEGYVVVANEQINGRGRNGHKFFSPEDTGVYMSIVLRPSQCSSKNAIKLTTMAAVAVCEAIESVSNQKAQVKWINDIYVGEKKVCGILTEAFFEMETNFLEYVVLGIGINVFPPKNGFPNELQDTAGSIFHKSQSNSKNHIAAEILNRFMAYYTSSQKLNYLNEYRRRSIVIGKEIDVISFDSKKKATALNINEDCHLIVRYDDGTFGELSSGEISIRIS